MRKDISEIVRNPEDWTEEYILELRRRVIRNAREGKCLFATRDVLLSPFEERILAFFLQKNFAGAAEGEGRCSVYANGEKVDYCLSKECFDELDRMSMVKYMPYIPEQPLSFPAKDEIRRPVANNLYMQRRPTGAGFYELAYISGKREPLEMFEMGVRRCVAGIDVVIGKPYWLDCWQSPPSNRFSGIPCEPGCAFEPISFAELEKYGGGRLDGINADNWQQFIRDEDLAKHKAENNPWYGEPLKATREECRAKGYPQRDAYYAKDGSKIFYLRRCDTGYRLFFTEVGSQLPSSGSEEGIESISLPPERCDEQYLHMLLSGEAGRRNSNDYFDRLLTEDELNYFLNKLNEEQCSYRYGWFAEYCDGWRMLQKKVRGLFLEASRFVTCGFEVLDDCTDGK